MPPTPTASTVFWRHGGFPLAFTPKDLPPFIEIGLDRVQVALLAANPNDYVGATGTSDVEWPSIGCRAAKGFRMTVAATGLPFEVAVLQSYASLARDFALSLGAVYSMFTLEKTNYQPGCATTKTDNDEE